jgi:serine protease Do
MNTRRSAWPIAVGVIVLGGLAALGWQTFSGKRIDAAPPNGTTTGAVAAVPASVLDMQNAFVTVAKGVRPAIVSITSRMTIKPKVTPGQFRGPEGFDMPDLRQFGFPNMPDMGQMRPVPRVAVGSGSGFIVRSDGWIMTNDHVVANADKVTVRLDDGREYTGDVRRDFRSDLALVKIPADNLPTLNLSDSSQVQVGQWAIAFGSPYGLRDTMTMGIVSALGRESTIGESQDDTRFYPNLIQTDASINPGNSGGPLLDIYGNVIGVNAAIGSPTGGNVGIGFAIPATTAKFVMEQLITKGTVTRGYLGLVPNNLQAADRQRYGVQDGALVTGVSEGSPAAKAGIQVEDVITAFNGQPIHNEVDLREAAARATPGQDATMTIVRNGKQQTVTVRIGEMPTEKAAQAVPQQSQGRTGMQVADLTPDVARQLGLDPNTKGVVVAAVQPASPAAEAGIQPGDVLVRIAGKDVTSASQAADIIKGLKAGETISVITRRDKTRILNRVQLP